MKLLFSLMLLMVLAIAPSVDASTPTHAHHPSKAATKPAKRRAKPALGITLASPAEACLAEVIYHEARGEPQSTMAGVAYVVLSRVGQDPWPGTICGVVLQSHPRGNSRLCQFSWACQGRRVSDPVSYRQAQQVAAGVLTGTIANPVRHSVYFNETKRKTSPSKHARFVVRLGHLNFFEDARRPRPTLLADQSAP